RSDVFGQSRARRRSAAHVSAGRGKREDVLLAVRSEPFRGGLARIGTDERPRPDARGLRAGAGKPHLRALQGALGDAPRRWARAVRRSSLTGLRSINFG